MKHLFYYWGYKRIVLKLISPFHCFVALSWWTSSHNVSCSKIMSYFLLVTKFKRVSLLSEFLKPLQFKVAKNSMILMNNCGIITVNVSFSRWIVLHFWGSALCCSFDYVLVALSWTRRRLTLFFLSIRDDLTKFHCSVQFVVVTVILLI